MFDAPFHPKIVHVPIALSVLMPLVTVGLIVAWFEDWLPSRAWWIAVALQAVLFAGSWLAISTGEDDEEKVEEIVPESAIETHEERADQFFWATGGLMILMVLPMVVPGTRRKKFLAVASLAGTVVVFWLGARVGEAGGDLVYEHGAGQAHMEAAGAGTSAPPGTGEADEEDEDD